MNKRVCLWLVAGFCMLLSLLACVGQDQVSRVEVKQKQADKMLPDESFFKKCVFVSVDIQPGQKHHTTWKNMPQGWKDRGFSHNDVNAADDFLHDVAIPNAVKIADACRRSKMPMIFIHWGYTFRDAMDLDPATRNSFLKQFGTAYDKWPHHISRSDSKPHEALKVRAGEYVIAKTAQDAFPSSNIDYVLKNLGVKNIVFVGGHTGACLGKTSQSAKKHGYRTLCIKDATFDARESTRIPNLEACNYDYVVTTDDFLRLIDRYCGQ